MAYQPRSIRLLALSQMIIGALMIILGVASICAVPHWSSYVGYGLWIGIWVFTTGILGYVGARYDASPNKCMIGVFMGFAIASIVLAGIMVICYAIALAQFSERLNPFYNRYNNYNYLDIEYYTAKNGTGIGSCLLILGVVDFFVALASSVYCCSATCNNGPVQSGVAVNQQVVYMQQQQSGNPGQVVVVNPSAAPGTLPTMQPMYFQGQPAYYVPTSGAPVNAAGAPMVVTSQAGQPMYWAGPTSAHVGAIPMSNAGGQAVQAGVITQPGQPVQWAGVPGAAAGASVNTQGMGMDIPPPYKQ